MNDFLLNNYTLLTRLIIGLAAITGLICYKQYKNSNVRYFIWFLVYIASFEILAGYTTLVHQNESLSHFKAILKDTKFERNYWVFNLFWNFLGTIFLSFYYSKILQTISYKRIIKWVTLIFILISVIYVSLNFDDFFNKSIVLLKVLAAIVVMMNTVFYFLEVLQGDNILTFYKSFNFYASAALFIWWLVTTPVVFYHFYFYSVDWKFILLRWQIFLSANFFMYLTFSFALIWCRREKN